MSLGELFGVKPKEEFTAEQFVVKKKAISPFDFANSINYTKENLS